MMQGQEMFTGWDGMWLGPITMLIIPVLVIVFIVWIIRSIISSNTPRAPQAPSPMDILAERFANGEIDAQEFEQRRKVLEQ